MSTTNLSSGTHRRTSPAEVAGSSVADDVSTGIAARVTPDAARAVVERTARTRPETPGPRPAPLVSDEQVAEAVAGDRDATGALLAAVRPMIVRYCRARLGRDGRASVTADDVAQEVCLAVLGALPAYRAQGRPFLAFVYGIAAHKVADAHRSAARNRSTPVADLPDGPDPGLGPEQRALADDLSRRMADLLRVLPEKQREIVLLRVVVGLSAEEVAEAVGSTPGAVRVAQHRALNRLRETLAAEPDRMER